MFDEIMKKSKYNFYVWPPGPLYLPPCCSCLNSTTIFYSTVRIDLSITCNVAWPSFTLDSAGWASVSCCFYCPKLCIQKRTPFCCPYVHSLIVVKYFWMSIKRSSVRLAMSHLRSMACTFAALKSCVPVVFFSHPSFERHSSSSLTPY